MALLVQLPALNKWKYHDGQLLTVNLIA